MPLAFMIEDVTKVDANLQPLYRKNDADNKFYLDVDGVVSKEKVDEFRTNNIALTKELEKFKGIDPAKWLTYVDLEAKGKLNGKTSAEVDAIITERVTSMRTEYDTKITGLTTERDTLQGQLGILLVDNVIRAEASKVGITGAAMDDALLRGKSTFKLVNGVATPHDPKGNIIYGPDGTTPMTPTQWISKLKVDAPHLFPESRGGGAPGGIRGIQPGGGTLSSHQKISQGLQAKT